jgi:hypothetical protein
MLMVLHATLMVLHAARPLSVRKASGFPAPHHPTMRLRRRGLASKLFSLPTESRRHSARRAAEPQQRATRYRVVVLT